ncbi:MAG: ABC transporter permease subunit [Gemmatimonadales bacterium]|nr:ABC transporter permease subunit [Gemmatimonadales bacterium]
MNREILFLFLRKELRDLRGNRQVWPAYLILSVVAAGLPVLMMALLPVLLDPARSGNDPALALLHDTVAADPSLVGATPAERVARLLLRDLGIFYLFIAVILASTSAALALVREKEQRTLEPILATPIRDRDLLLAKLLASLGPAMLATWAAALAGTVAGMLGSWWRIGVVILPTGGNLLGLLFLAPALAALAALLALRVSARFTDVPSATQFTGLVVVPTALVMVAIVGRPAMADPLVTLTSAAVVAAIAAWFFFRSVRRFRREEILTRWR